MNATRLAERLKELGFTPEAFDDQLYASGSYGGDSKNNSEIQRQVGSWTVIKRNERVEIDGSFEERTILHFTVHDIYLAGNTYSGSYNTTMWTDWYEVFPTQITTFTDKKQEEASSYDSYESSYDSSY